MAIYYIETTIPSFYYEVRPEPDMVARRDWTRRHKLMPVDPFGDALHLALASYHRCDFLVTWNCQHLANARKFGHIRRINGILGLFVPEIVTPMELLGEAWTT
jgi:hypothetical protein